MVVPPIVDEIRALPEELHRFYMYLRQAMGPFAQGPVALIARHADECVFSADALGLRPLWQVETERRLRLQLRARRRLGRRRWSPSRSRSPRARRRWCRSTATQARSTLHPHDEMLRIVRERWLERTGAPRTPAL